MTSRTSIALLWLLMLASVVAHVLQWRELRTKETLQGSGSELQNKVQVREQSLADSPLLQALREDFRTRSEEHIFDIATAMAGTADEAFGKKLAMEHAAKLQACGLLPADMTAERFVDGAFKNLSKPQ